MRGRLQRNLATVALAAALVVSSIYVAGGLTRIDSSVPTVHLVKPPSVQREQPFGTLSIDVLLGTKETYYGADSIPTYFRPIGGEKVSISLSNSPETTPLVLVTNARGVIRAGLPVSNYYVGTIRDERFHVAIPFSILANTTTFIVVSAIRLSSPVLYDEVYPTPPGSNATAETIFLKIDPTAAFSNSSLSVFLERSALTAKNFVDPSTNSSVTQSPVKILEESADARGLWAQLQTYQVGSPTEPSQLSLVTYIPVYTEVISSR